MSTVALSSRRVLADRLPTTALATVLLTVSAAAFIGLLAQFAIHLSFSPVPITGQTLGVLLTGSALGFRRASAAIALYIVAGLAGVPWFTGHTSGYVGPLFGYLVGFLAASSLLGYLASRGNDHNVARATLSMALGEVVIFAFGVTWLAFALHVSFTKAIGLGFTPFIAGELIKAAVAGLALPATWRLVDRADRA
jgi:biotin transport system substrate-specific component